MRIKYNDIKIIGLILLVGFLFAFSNQRNSVRKVDLKAPVFIGENKLFITDQTVSKLLIQNQRPLTEQPKDIIDLNELEVALNSNSMIKKAEVFMSVEGEL